MSALVLDDKLVERLKAQRVESGAARWDEVWDGVYVMSPLPNIEHQAIVGWLLFILQTALGESGLGKVFPGVNVSDRDDDWTQNYRCPDVAVFLTGGSAKDRDTYWLGGPGFAVEIVSPNDRVHQKLSFYETVGVHELLIIDRDPWALELHRLEDGVLHSVGRSTIEHPADLVSVAVPLSFRLAAGEGRPRIEATQRDGQGRWSF